MVSRRKKWLWRLLAVLVLLPLGLVITMRAMRGSHETPVTVRGQVMRMRNFFTEMYAARVADKVVLFDAGIDNDGKALDALLDALHAKRDDVSHVFLTHGHFDHVAASPLCKKAEIHVGIQDSDMLAHRAPIASRNARWFERILPVPAIFATAAFLERTELSLPDGKKMVAIPLPGHTPGSYALYYDEVLFGGDSIQISDGKLEFAMPSFSLDMAANKRSIANLKSALSGLPVDIVCTGHQGCTPPGQGQKLLDELVARAGS